MAKAEAEAAPGKPSLFCTVDGVNIARLFETAVERPMQEHIDLVKGMEMRSDDVLIGAFGKAGTHWIWEVVSMILAGKAEYEKRTKEFTMFEATKFEQLQAQPSPRVFNSHLPLRLLPRQIKEKKVRVVHVYRNCKDILVSGYFHFRQMSIMSDITLEDVENMMIRPGAPGGDYFLYLKLMDEYKKNNPDVPLFTMSFEDTKEDPERAVRQLAEFLGANISAQLVSDIAEATSITKMREADKAKQQRSELPHSQMYRKGQVGDWKNYLTVAQSERLDAAMSELESCDYHFRYTL